MLNRLCAGILLVLVALPFTAPFSTCDLSVLLGSADADNAVPAGGSSRAQSAPGDSGVLLVASARLVRAGRAKQLLVADGDLLRAEQRIPELSRPQAGPSSDLLAHRFTLTTILRL